MKPYYEHAGITIYHGDCRDFADIPIANPAMYDALLLTDPPYGIALENHDPDVENSRPEGWTIQGDHSQQIGQDLLDRFSYLATFAFASPRKPWSGDWDQRLVWWKGPAVGGGGHPEKYWKLDWELVQARNLGVLRGNRDSGVLRYWTTPQDSPHHPAQKPLNLLRYLISKVDALLVIDPFCGSGSTLVAAKNEGRRAIGIEIEEKYCEIAAKRLSQEVFDFTSSPEKASK